jgi:hypothetical protein
MWDLRGWKHLTVHDDPPLVAARQEFLSWLAEVPEPNRTVWEGRLKSELDHPHFSVRLELYLHHYFKSNDWHIDIEPEMLGSLNKPDFRVSHGEDCILVEAKTVLEEKSTAQQTQRLRQLADDLTNKLSRYIIIQPLSDLPTSLPTRRIRNQVEQHAKTLADKVLEFDLRGVHLNTPYILKVVILPKGPEQDEAGGVGGTVSGVHTLAIGRRIRDALEQKADKYGDIDVPFLRAVCGKGEFPVKTGDEVDALFGDRVFLVPTKRGGAVTESRKPNGFFTSMKDGAHRHEQVSAILFYRFKWLEDGHVHHIHIYHNPFAQRTMNTSLFPEVPQMVPCDNEKMMWVNGEPE